jgi:hypothetical protein
MSHPSSLELEAFACGDDTPKAVTDVARHLDECGACRSFVERLRALVTAGPSKDAARELVARLSAEPAAARSVDQERRDDRPVAPRAAPLLAVVKGRARWRTMVATTSVLVPLAAAAVLLLLVRGPAPKGTAPPSVEPPVTTSPTTIATGPSVEPETTFKGTLQVAVIRDRNGEQARFTGPLRVRAGDRLRLEVALEREQAILGAVMGDDGSYLEIMPAGVRGAGTHFSERSARVDASPTPGVILIGSPEAVAHARETRRFDDVILVRVDPEHHSSPPRGVEPGESP